MNEYSQIEETARNRIRARIQTWLDESIDRVTDSVSQYDHVDFVLGEKLTGSNSIEMSLEAFSVLRQCIIERHAPVLPALFIRLRSLSSKVTFAAPANLQEIKDQWRAIEPPSLILYGLNYRTFVPIVEEYHCPLRFNLFARLIDGVFAYYSESRDTGDEDDFDRVVIVTVVASRR